MDLPGIKVYIESVETIDRDLRWFFSPKDYIGKSLLTKDIELRNRYRL
jgi:hypothetical protein